jgi:hypothetical protein
MRIFMWTAAKVANGQKKSEMSPSNNIAQDIDATGQLERSDTPFCGEASGTIFLKDIPLDLQ